MYERNTINKIILIGNIDGELSWEIHGNNRYLCFTLVTLEQFRGDNGRIHHERHNIRATERMINIEQLTSTATLCVQGSIQTRIFIDEQRIKRYHAEIVATSIDIVEL